jgi:RNA polymerase sigma-70 factor (ECF subfamily)
VKEQMTDEAILQLTTRAETLEEGFRHLVIKHQERLYHVIRNRVSSHEDADDVLQNTFMKVFKNIAGFEGRSGLFTWMYRIATNEVNNHHKRTKRFNVETLDENGQYQADAYVNTDNLEQRIETVISKLPARQQTVFRMRYYDELTYREMASMLDVTEGALKASFHHAVRKIEEALTNGQVV